MSNIEDQGVFVEYATPYKGEDALEQIVIDITKKALEKQRKFEEEALKR